MLVKHAKKLTPLERFIYWIKERHNIYLAKEAGKPKPWTDDEVLRSYFFTNPYRENDKTTVWFRENVRDPLRHDDAVLMATVIFRWFNLPQTGELLMGRIDNGAHRNLLEDWREVEAVKRLNMLWADGETPVFTGAYMIKAGNGPRGCKIPNVCAAISNVWQDRDYLASVCRQCCSLEALWQELITYPFLGGFMAYEIVSDLRYTSLLDRADDIFTWCNPGPGAVRGLLRLEGGVPGVNPKNNKVRRMVKVVDPLGKMQKLLDAVNLRLPTSMPRFEMREVEHSLCEFDKYSRALFDDGGRMKRTYDGC